MTRSSALLTMALAALVGCGSSPEAPKAPAADKKPASDPKHPPAQYRLKLETSKGDIVVEVKREWAPRAADRFWELASSGYYDESRFYRVLRGAIAQFGISGNPKVNQKWRGLAFADEPAMLKNTAGTLAFAKAGKNARNTQVFINLRNNPELDKQKFVPFARIVEGMDVAASLHAKYGETSNRGGGGPDGIKAEAQGNEYLARQFTQLDYIKRVVVIR